MSPVLILCGSERRSSRMRRHIRKQYNQVVLQASINNPHAEVTWSEVEQCLGSFAPDFTREDLDGIRTYVMTCATGFDALLLQSYLRRLAPFIGPEVELALAAE